MEVKVMDAIDAVYDEVGDLMPTDLLVMSNRLQRLTDICKGVAEAIRESSPTIEFAKLKDEVEQRFFKALFEGQFMAYARELRLKNYQSR